MKINFNRLSNISNRFQGNFPKVLAVCSAGLLRSPTIAWVLSNPPFNFNTRAVGTSSEFALIPLDGVHLHWADIIVCADEEHEWFVKAALEMAEVKKPIICLNLPDEFPFKDPELVKMISEICTEVFDEMPDLRETNKTI